MDNLAQSNNISFYAKDEEIMRFDADGYFYVRGQKVDINADEGKLVFDGFKQFLNMTGYLPDTKRNTEIGNPIILYNFGKRILSI